jgi:hypothetical protein
MVLICLISVICGVCLFLVLSQSLFIGKISLSFLKIIHIWTVGCYWLTNFYDVIMYSMRKANVHLNVLRLSQILIAYLAVYQKHFELALWLEYKTNNFNEEEWTSKDTHHRRLPLTFDQQFTFNKRWTVCGKYDASDSINRYFPPFLQAYLSITLWRISVNEQRAHHLPQ